MVDVPLHRLFPWCNGGRFTPLAGGQFWNPAKPTETEVNMAHLVWDVNPEIFTIGPLAPRYYGLLFVLGFFVGYLLLRRSFRQIGKGEDNVVSLLYHMTFGAIIGARLGHILFYRPQVFLTDPLEIIKIWEGGLASHGGALGVMAALWLFRRKHRDIGCFWLADHLAPAIAFTAFCVRVGNFFNSEILGRPSSVPWAITFARVDAIPRHPAMLYEAFSYLALFVVLMLPPGKLVLRPGARIGLLLVWIFAARFVIEFFKEHQIAFETHLPLTIGQLLSIPFVVLGLLFMAGVFNQPAKPPHSGD
jgi:phosphatidylglycerol---prolipoprotein diacylglyceryl transferase